MGCSSFLINKGLLRDKTILLINFFINIVFSSLFKDEKYSLLDKSEAWLLCSNNQIVWIIGDRQDDRFKVTETTTKILKIKYSE